MRDSYSYSEAATITKMITKKFRILSLSLFLSLNQWKIETNALHLPNSICKFYVARSFKVTHSKQVGYIG